MKYKAFFITLEGLSLKQIIFFLARQGPTLTDFIFVLKTEFKCCYELLYFGTNNMMSNMKFDVQHITSRKKKLVKKLMFT